MAAESTTTLGAGRAVNAPSRRHLIGGTILAAACGAAFAGAVVLPNPGEAFAVVASPDAELVRLCAECDALQRQIDALFDEEATPLPHAQQLVLERARDRVVEPLRVQQDPLLARIVEMRATTLQAHVARARTLAGWDKAPSLGRGRLLEQPAHPRDRARPGGGRLTWAP